MLFGDINAEILRRAGAPLRGENINAQIQQRASATMAPTTGRNIPPMANRYIPTSGTGDTALRLPISRSAVSQMTVNRAGVVPSTTLALAGRNGGTISSASAFGGSSGGMGASLGPSTVSDISSSITSAGTGIMNTLGSYIPLAIKIILAVIVIKIVLWLVRGRKR